MLSYDEARSNVFISLRLTNPNSYLKCDTNLPQKLCKTVGPIALDEN